MELFSEIHSRYFYIISEILKVAAKDTLTANDVAEIVARLGFAETSLSLTPALLKASKDSYCLLTEESCGYRPVLKKTPLVILTELQKRWLKTLLQDKRFSLFASNTDRIPYDTLLEDIEPLYCADHIINMDMANDGDDYDSPAYQKIFKTLLQALQNKKIVYITYESGKGNRITARFAPYKLEYSLKDDKFRLCAMRMRQEKMRSLYKLNLSRIAAVEITEHTVPRHLAKQVKNLRVPLPVEIEISNERNGFERIFTQLSNFERVSEYDEATKKCLMKIYYYEVDEMELLITLLSFGPMIRVLGHERFKKKFIERIAKQKQLLLLLDTSPSL